MSTCIHRAARALALGCALLALAALASAERMHAQRSVRLETQRFDPGQDVGIDQRLGETLPLDLRVTSSSGQQVSMRELLGGRPTILAFVYYECPQLCGEVLSGLARAMRVLRLELGEEYGVLALSIDPEEGSALAAEKRARFLRSMDWPVDARGFEFATADQASIEALTGAAGFRYALDMPSGEYAHAGGLMVVTPEGRLSHYFYGIEFAPKDLRLALVEASQGRIGNLVDRVLLLCMHYDPSTGAYGYAVIGTLRVFGLLTVLVLGTFVALALARELRASAATPPPAG
jgi:protein SCO1/2